MEFAKVGEIVPQATTSSNSPPCLTDKSDLVYVNGIISLSKTLQKCVENIADPLTIPTFYKGTYNGVLLVNTSIQVNNLHSIDAVAGETTLDFYLRLYWYDNRLAMPIFWNQTSPHVQKDGIDITSMLDSNPGINIWKPDVRFHDASEVEYIVQTIRINASNVLFWSRHTKITLIQPKLDFSAFPGDSQSIDIRFGSYAFNQKYLKMNYYGNELSMNTNYDGTYTFLSNPVWQFNSQSTSFGTYVSGSNFLNSIYHISVQRNSVGSVNRITTPILTFMLIISLTFWIQPEKRVGICLAIQTAVSALYIVILGNIPLVGYLTTIDVYVYYSFVIILVCTVFHVFYATVEKKKGRFPLRIIGIRLVETIGRVFIFPFLLIFYAFGIEGLDNFTVISLTVAACVGGIIVFIRELPGIRAARRSSRRKLIQKKKDAKFPLSVMEVVVLGIFSSEIEMLTSDDHGIENDEDDNNINNHNHISRVDDDDVEDDM